MLGNVGQRTIVVVNELHPRLLPHLHPRIHRLQVRALLPTARRLPMLLPCRHKTPQNHHTKPTAMHDNAMQVQRRELWLTLRGEAHFRSLHCGRTKPEVGFCVISFLIRLTQDSFWVWGSWSFLYQIDTRLSFWACVWVGATGHARPQQGRQEGGNRYRIDTRLCTAPSLTHTTHARTQQQHRRTPPPPRSWWPCRQLSPTPPRHPPRPPPPPPPRLPPPPPARAAAARAAARRGRATTGAA